MKRVLLIVFLALLSDFAFAQWKKVEMKADELKGIPETVQYSYTAKGVGTFYFRYDDHLLYVESSNGVFNYRKALSIPYCVVTTLLGFYDKDNNLIEKNDGLLLVDPDNPKVAYNRNESNCVKVLSWLKEGKGSVRYVIEMYDGKQLDITIPPYSEINHVLLQ